MKEFGLTFNEDIFVNDLIKHLIKYVQGTAIELMHNMKSKADNSMITIKENKGGKTQTTIANSWKAEIIDMGINSIVALVGNDHWWAFIDNYGSGSKMAGWDKNPFLEEYLRNNDAFYGERANHNYSVLVRPLNTYNVPDWERGTGYTTRLVKGHKNHLWKTKGREGNPRDLEEMKRRGENSPIFKAQEPKFWFDNEFDFMEKRFYETILEAIDSFPFESDKYLKGGY